MTASIRHVVFASLTLLILGIGAGFLPAIVEFPASVGSAQTDTPELGLLPDNPGLLASVNLQAVMASPFGRQIRQAVPPGDEGQRQFEAATGISINRDIDRVVVYLAQASDTERPPDSLVLARGRFDMPRIESLMREQGATVEEYKGRRLSISERLAAADPSAGANGAVALTFIEPGLAAVGSPDLVRRAVDRKDDGKSAAPSGDVLQRVRSLDGDVWAVARFDASGSRERLPDAIAGQLPPISWLTASLRIREGMDGVLQAETPDEESATSLRDLVRGFIAIGKLQAPAGPGMQVLLQSLQLGGAGNTVMLSFNAPAELFDLLVPSSAPTIP